MRAASRLRGALAVGAAPMVLLAILGVRLELSPAHYLPVHVFIEFGIALVGFATFAVQWYAAGSRGVREARARFLGAAALAMAALELCHVLVFPGMPGFLGPSSVERGIHYWLAARFLMTGALVASAFVPPASESPLLGRRFLTAAALVTAVAFAALESTLPPVHGRLHVPGLGLTPLKIGLEASVAALAIAGAALHLRRYVHTRDATLLRTAAALGWLVLAEVCFSLYASAHDSFNLLGHVYAGVSAWLMFDALFVAALLRPYRRLDRTTRDLAASNARLEELRAHVEGELARTIARLEETTAAAERARGEIEAAVAAFPDAIMRYAPDGSIVSMNAGAEGLLGYAAARRELPLAERFASLDPRAPDGAPLTPSQNPVARALRGEVVQGLPIVIRVDGGRPCWVTVSAAPVRGTAGAIAGAIAVFTDVSELQQLQAEREDLLRAVSHDLRNPLQIVLLQAERLQKLLPSTSPKERKSAETIGAAAKQMGAMIRDLVDAVRMEGGRLVLAREPIDVASWLPERIAMTSGVLDVGRVEYEFPPDLPHVWADPHRLERIVTNLLGNALKYSPAGSPVRVCAAARDEAVALSVSDRGVGIAPEDLPRLFERFYRGKLTSRYDGLGLGLYIVRMLVEAHGGRVSVESRPGEGSTFSFTLPVSGGR